MVRCTSRLFNFGFYLSAVAWVGGAFADGKDRVDQPYRELETYSHFGNHGLVQMPNARFGQPGNFAVGWVRVAPYRFLTINITPLDWFEAAVRYTGQEDRRYQLAAAIGDTQSNKDKGIDAKIRLLKEDVWLPQVALGVRDLGGTGLFGSEYLVASKRFNSLDVSAGLGWGLMGSRGQISNPMKVLSDRFNSRSSTTGEGGTLSLDDYFSGDSVSVFGGVSYRTEIPGLVANLELDGSNYTEDSSSITSSSPFNLGLTYRYNPVVDFQVGFERGDTLSAGVVLRTNFAESQQPLKLDPEVQVSRDKLDTEQFSEMLSNSAFDISVVRDLPTVYALDGNFNRYPDDAKGLASVAKLAAGQLDGRDLSITEASYGMPVREWTIPPPVIERLADNDLDAREVSRTVLGNDPTAKSRPDAEFSQFMNPWDASFKIAPNLEQSFQSPEAFWIYRLKLSGHAELKYKESTSLLADVSASLSDNYDELRLQESSLLPPVRTQVRQYFKENRELYLERLQLTHFEPFAPSWYSQMYVGHLEPMFSGFGGELLYRPYDTWWSVGFDVNRVWQRSFDSFAGRQDYVVNTGHVSANFELPWDGLRLKSSYGRYLAGDKGVTIDAAREFDNGFTVGVWATQTDVSAREFGEGSFDKGAYLLIPFDVFTTESTRSLGSIGWRPMQRDGGQKLGRRFDLYQMTQSRGIFNRVDDWSAFLE